jgi:hypothetical protein
MTRRRLLLVALLVTLLVLGIGGWLAFGPEKIQQEGQRPVVPVLLPRPSHLREPHRLPPHEHYRAAGPSLAGQVLRRMARLAVG